MSSSEYENLICVVRTDADARRRLVLKACFLAALAEHAPAVVKHPTREKKWRKGDLDAIAAGTLARVKNDGPRSELHCVVGVDDFNANLRYAKGSLVYLRAETKPPLRVLLYASLPPPTRAETPPPTVASGGGANDAAEREKRAAAANAAAANGVKIVDAGAATEETLALIVAALSSEPPPSTAEAGEEKIATWASSKARDALTFAHGAFWHVVHDQHVFGAAVRATGAGGGEDNDNAKGGGVSTDADPGLRVVARRGKHAFTIWHHNATPRTYLQIAIASVEWMSVFKSARFMFVFVVAVYGVWYNKFCAEDEVNGGARAATWNEIRKNTGTAGWEEFVNNSPLSALDGAIAHWGCKAGPSLAPAAVLVLMGMAASGSGFMNSIGRAAAMRMKRRSAAAAKKRA